MRRQVGKSLSVGLSVFVLIATVLAWISHQPEEGELPRALRQVHEFNSRLWQKLYRGDRLSTSMPPPRGKRPRFNGDLGLGDDFDPRHWRLRVNVENKQVAALTSTELQLLPHTNTSTEFKCIEGWSDVISYEGVKFSDFLKAYKLPNTYKYVGLVTPDGGYYVSIDMESMLHPQTLLAWKMNDQPLSMDDGAPLRLIIPVKYGIKSLKRIGTISFSNQRPPDYWAERGYDWYSGL